MLARFLPTLTLVLLIGCTADRDPPPGAAEQSQQRASGSEWFKERIAQGRAVYQQSCASCHDAGAGDAPAIGVKQDWDNRSRLWTAVLFEHAKAGYLEMPARGGAPGLTDEQVSAAAEYILTVTYPELPVD